MTYLRSTNKSSQENAVVTESCDEIESMKMARKEADVILCRAASLISSLENTFYDVEEQWKGKYSGAYSTPSRRLMLSKKSFRDVGDYFQSVKTAEELRDTIKDESYLHPIMTYPDGTNEDDNTSMGIILPMQVLATSTYSGTKALDIPDDECIKHALGQESLIIVVNGTDSSGPFVCEEAHGNLQFEDEPVFENKNASHPKAINPDGWKRKIGEHKYMALIRSFSTFISDSDLMLSQDAIESCAAQAIRIAASWDTKVSQSLTSTAVKGLFGQRSGAKPYPKNAIVLKHKIHPQVIRCHVGTRRWSEEYFGLGVAIEIGTEVSIFVNPNPHAETENCDDYENVEANKLQKIGLAKCTIVQGYTLSASDLGAHQVFYDCDLDLSTDTTKVLNKMTACSVAEPMQGCTILRIKPFLSKDNTGDINDKAGEEDCHKSSTPFFQEAWDYISDDSDSDDELSSKKNKLTNKKSLKQGVPLSEITKTVQHNLCNSEVEDNVQPTTGEEVYAWGDNQFNCLGHLPSGDTMSGKESSTSRVGTWLYTPEPQMVPLDVMSYREKVQSIACSPYHTLALTSSGSVYSCGDGSDGQLGHGHTFSCQSFQLVEWFIAGLSSNENKPQVFITQISAGADEVRSHSAAVDSAGAIYTWGRATVCGHVGYGPKLNDVSGVKRSKAKTEENVLLPQRIESFCNYKVLKVSCGGSFTIAIAVRKQRNDCVMKIHEQTSVYSWGVIAGGRLGTGKPKVEADTSILGTQKKKVPIFVPRPTLIRGLEHCQIIDVSTGSAHALALSAQGEVYAWGRNREGQCCALPVNPSLSGNERDHQSSSIWDDVWIPRKIPTFAPGSIFAQLISTGGSQSGAVDSDGKVWAWGGSYDKINPGLEERQAKRALMSGYLTPPKWSNPRLVESLQNTDVVKLSFGDNHGAAVTKNGQIYIWDSSPLSTILLKDVSNTDESDKTMENNTFQSRHYAPRQPNWKWFQPLDGKNVRDVVCAGGHTFALTRGNSISIHLEELSKKSIDFSSENKSSSLYSESDAETSFHENLRYDIGVDCVIVVAGRRINCHKVILIYRSAVLKNMIELEERPEDGSSTIELLLLDIPYGVMRSMVHFMYTDQVYLQDVSTYTKTLNLLIGAEKLALTRLVAICKKILSTFEERAAPQDKDDAILNVPPSTMITDMGEILKDGRYTDVRLLVGDKIILCHQCILMTRTYFRSLLLQLRPKNKDIEMNSQQKVVTIELPGRYVEIIRVILFVYSGVLPSRSEKELKEDMANAHMYALWDLKEQCESALEVTHYNVYDLLDLSVSADAKRLKCEALRYLSENISLCLSKKEYKEHWQKIQEEHPQLLSDLFEQVKEFKGVTAVIPRDRSNRTTAYLEEQRLKEEARKERLATKMMGGDTKEAMNSLLKAFLLLLMAWAYAMLQNFLALSQSAIVPVINAAFVGCCLYFAAQTLKG